MECVVLGTGGMMPMPTRLTSSVLVRLEGRMLMFDAGEGIQLALKRGGLGIVSLDAVVISHLHADHVLGLPGIMMFRAQNSEPGPLTIIGPPGLGRFLRHIAEDLRFHINFAYNVVEWHEKAPRLAWEWRGVKLFWECLVHSTFCLGYRLEEPMRPGKFQVAKAEDLGIPKGPLYGELQGGREITLDSGRVISPSDVLGPPRRGRVVAYATDTRPCPGLEKVVTGADIAFVEGMFAEKHSLEAAQKKHMTAAEAAQTAAKTKVKRLILTHLSPRYSKEEEPLLEAEARKHFGKAEVARALGAYSVPLI
jgi:ribonuclease Z